MFPGSDPEGAEEAGAGAVPDPEGEGEQETGV